MQKEKSQNPERTGLSDRLLFFLFFLCFLSAAKRLPLNGPSNAEEGVMSPLSGEQRTCVDDSANDESGGVETLKLTLSEPLASSSPCREQDGAGGPRADPADQMVFSRRCTKSTARVGC